MQSLAKSFRVDQLMEMPADISFQDQYKLRLSTKKLSSGKCQVKFYASVQNSRDLYGYVLVESDQTLRDVVVRIKEKLVTIQQTRDFHHIHLYSIGKTRQKDDMNFIIFDS